jgi:hypothetical protein
MNTSAVLAIKGLGNAALNALYTQKKTFNPIGTMSENLKIAQELGIENAEALLLLN